MLTAWRLTKTKFLSTAWDGEGARRAGAHWNSVGTAMVYVSGTLSLALLETLVHVSSGILPGYTAVPVEFDASLVTILEAKDLPADWKANPVPPSTQAIGDKWAAESRTAAFRVPSVLVPGEFNFALNPRHPDFRLMRIGSPVPFPFDPRLL